MSSPTIFHEPWWLDAAAGDRWVEVRAALSSGQRGSLKIFRTAKWGVPTLDMPPLTRTLGPQIEGLDGKPETKRRMKLFLLDEIIRQLPPHIIFNQVVEPGEIDALAFRLNGYSVNVEYTYRLEDCSDSARILADMRDTMRRVIRRAEERLIVQRNVFDVEAFVAFYFGNLALRDRIPNHSRAIYRRVLEAAFAHEAAEIFTAIGPDGTPCASICTVFDNRSMYYLLTTQNRLAKDNGSVAVLIWNAIKSAGERGLAFDFDGFGDRGTALFLSQFGGALCPRLRVSRMPKLLQAVMHLGPRFTNTPVRSPANPPRTSG